MVTDASSAPIDLDGLRALFKGSLDEALGLFLGVARGVARELPALVAGREATAVWTSSHKLVGSARMAGAAALAAACDALCDAADAEDWPAAEVAARQVVAEAARIDAWMERRCGVPAS